MTLLKNPNELIGTPYDTDKYHCWHFIEECLDVPTLNDISVHTVKNDVNKYKDLFTQIETPVNYCIILIGDKHIGIYYNNGAYHNDVGGVRYESLRTLKLKYKGFKYYDIRN